MTLRELADLRFYASLFTDFDFGRAGVHASALARTAHAEEQESNDGFEETRPCSWYVTVMTDDPASTVR